ncbi:MAG: sulfatase activating formylglycine-generating enzyme [Pirellulaceae bacterium]|jgi:formylglycine-generating enzyme required for sulfatase activity
MTNTLKSKLTTLARLVILAMSLNCVPSNLVAEHRVALLIGNSAYKNPPDKLAEQDLAAVATGLEKYGFKCRTLRNLENENAIRDAIESFAASTPTCSTALVYYSGRIDAAGKFIGIDSRSKYEFGKLLEVFEKRGGSRRNLLFIDCPQTTKFAIELPELFQLTLGSTAKLLADLDGKTDLVRALAKAGDNSSTLANDLPLTGVGSQAISPADKFALGLQAGDQWVNNMGIVFCWCPPGRYLAGSPQGTAGRYADEAQREINIDTGFWLSKYELARGQEVAQRRPGRTIARHKLDPMTMINHDDAKTMMRNFTQSERQAARLPEEWEYSLSTEEQWEYAARAGSTTPYFFGTEITLLPRYANFADKSYYDSGEVYSNAAHRTLDDGTPKLSRVGSYAPNPWGIHDMYGNVAEWCNNLAIRGGSWVSVPENCRSAYRDSFSSRNEQNFIGYRLVIQKNAAVVKK